MNGKEYSHMNNTKSGRKSLDTYCQLVAFFNAFENKGKDELYVLNIMGKSASGKNYLTSLLRKWAKAHFPKVPVNFIVSDTTRPKRAEETDGREYNFLTPVKFHENIFNKKYAEYEKFNGWFYGTQTDSFDRKKLNVRIITPRGCSRMLPFLHVRNMYMYLEASLPTRLKRMHRREGKWKIEYLRRAFRDHRDFSYYSYANYLKDEYSFDSRYIRDMFSGQD